MKSCRKNEIEWLSVMRGLNILLVVMGHAHLIDLATNEPFPMMEQFNSYLVPIRMPLFIFCSGGLLFLSRINKKWTILNLYHDKARRLLYPFVFFVTFYYLLKIAMNTFVKTKVDYSWLDFLTSFAIYNNHPSVHLWFLAVLMWLMLLYPLFYWLNQSNKRMMVFMAFCIALYFVDINPNPNKNYFYLFTLNHYLVYFFAGIFFFRFRLYDYFTNWWTTLLFVVLYIITYLMEQWFLTSITGIFVAVSLSRQIAKFRPELFSSFRESIYQIYLISLIFQGLVELVIWPRFYYPQIVLLFYMLSILMGIYIPVIISKMAERTNYRWIQLTLGLKTTLLFIVWALLPIRLLADTSDQINYPPPVNTQLDKTNLPIVFIDTRYGRSTNRIIYKDIRIAVRMKIINNADGINYGDTIAHPNQTVDYEGWAAIRHRGSSSYKWSPKKPYNFKTMKTADVNGEKQKTELLGMPKDHTWLLQASYGDRSMLRDVLVFQLARPWFDYTPRCRYCEMVLDDIYYGIYILTENIRKGEHRLNLDDPGLSGDELTGGYQLQIDRNNEPHFTSKYPAVDSHGNIYDTYNEIYLQYKHPDLEEMDSLQVDYIQRRVEQMEDVLASDDFTNPDTGYSQYLDPLSFIDQQLSQEFSGNVDGYRLSTNIYKHRDSQDPRFKTAIWDFDLAFGNSNAANAQGTDFWRYQNSYLTNENAHNKVPFWWMRLMEDPAYVKQLKERWTQYRQSNYNDQYITATIDSITSLLRKDGALERNSMAWNLFSDETYDMEIDRVKKWISKRVAWLDEQLEYDPTNIIMPSASFNKTIVGYYSIKGMRLSQPPRQGICIVRYSDGTSKVIIRNR